MTELRSSDLANPFFAMLQVEPQQLFGRDDALREIMRGATERQPSSFQIAALRGVGKSGLLRYLANPGGAIFKYPHFLHAPFNAPGRLLIIYIDGAQLASEESFLGLLRQRLVENVAGLEMPPTGRGTGAAQTAQVVRQLLLSVQRDERRALILLNHFDAQFETLPADEANQLRPLATLASIVVGTERPLIDLNEVAYASWFGGLAREIVLRPLQRYQAQALLRSGLEQAGEERLREIGRYYRLLPLTGHHPPYILRGAGELLALSEKAPSMPDDYLSRIIRDRLTSVFRGHYFVRYWRWLSQMQQESLCRLMLSRQTPEDAPVLQDLSDRGLLEWEEPEVGREARFTPFSELWRDYLQEQAGHSEGKKPREVLDPEVLTPRQKELLDYLFSRPGEVCAHEEILDAVWNRPASDRDLRLLRETVRQLRQKLEDQNAGEIVTRHGEGYEYRPSAEPRA